MASLRRFARSASHTPSRATIVLMAAGAIAVLVGLTVIALVAPRGVPGLQYYELNAQFDDAAQIADLSEVRIAGRHVGQVTTSEVRNGHATVRLQFFPGQKPLRADTRARIRLKGLLGAKFVDVTPGRRGRPLPNGATLPARQDSTAVQMLDVLQAFDARTRRNLQTAVKGLGEGFLGRGPDLNEMIGTGRGFVGDARAVSDAILARGGAAERFAPSAESLAGAYDPVRDELAAGFDPEARVLQAVADSHSAIDRTLAEAPGSLDALRQGLDAATPLLGETARLARATTHLTAQAPAALRQTSALLRESRPALQSSRPLLQDASAAVSPTLAFLRHVDPVIQPARRSLDSNLPGLREFGSRGCDFLGFSRNWRSSLGFGVGTGFGDPTGTLDDGEPGLGPLTSLRVVAVRPAELESLNADAPPKTTGDAYPSPCAAVKEHTG